jgi:hypothetical protein
MMGVIETVDPIPPFDYGDCVRWLADNADWMFGSIVSFEHGKSSNGDVSSAWVELPDTELVRIPCSKLIANP